MDGSVERTNDRTLIPAAAPQARVSRDGRGGGKFQMNPSKQKSPEKATQEPRSQDEDLPVGHAAHDESGKHLDVTA